MRAVANLLEVPVADIAHVLSINMLSAFSPAELLACAKRPDLDAGTREDIVKRLALVGAYDACQEVQALPPPAAPSKPVNASPLKFGDAAAVLGACTWGESATNK